MIVRFRCATRRLCNLPHQALTTYQEKSITREAERFSDTIRQVCPKKLTLPVLIRIQNTAAVECRTPGGSSGAGCNRICCAACL